MGRLLRHERDVCGTSRIAEWGRPYGDGEELPYYFYGAQWEMIRALRSLSVQRYGIVLVLCIIIIIFLSTPTS